MTRAIRADYSQTFLLPPSLEDWVGADHPARFIRDFVESLDFRDLGFCTPSCDTGRLRYSNELLESAWLFGYVQKIHSSRGLERACRDNDCSVRWECSPNKKGRTILRGEHEKAVSRQREKQKLVRQQEIIRSRKWIVEPICGQIKENMGFRRWTVRGMENVRTQWSLIGTAFNLQKLYKHWLEGTLVLNR